MKKTAEEILREKIENELGDLSSDDNFLRLIHFPNVAVLAAMEEYAAQFAAPPPASEGEILQDEINKCNEALMQPNFSIDNYRCYWEGRKALAEELLATLPTREPEAKEKFAVHFSEWLMIQCDYKNHCVWEYQGEEYTQQELIEIFKRMTPSLPTQSITN